MILLAACGTTVQTRGTANGSAADEGLGPAGSLAAAGDGSAGGPALAGPAGLVPGGATGSAAPGASAQAQVGTGTNLGSAAGPEVTAESGRGFTKTAVEIGMSTADDSNAFIGTLGIKGVTTTGDAKAQMQAVVNDVNRRGGLLGRKIALVVHNFNSAQTLNDPATANQAACADWTQDHHVAAVVGAQVVDDTLLECLARANTPLIQAGGLDFPLHYAESYARYPLFFNIAQMVGDRYDRIAIGRLAARHFFTPWDTLNGQPGSAATPVKMGLLGYDDSDGARQLASQQKQLARHGIKVAPADVIRCPRPLSSTVSCQQSAVLKLSSDNVTHVTGAGLIFIEQAESQHYRPRYFFAYEPRVIAENAPEAQLHGSMGESYIPVMDVEPSEYPGDPTAAATYCKKVLKEAGQLASDSTTLWSELINCDEIYFLKAAVEASGGLGTAALRAGFERLGSSTPSALTWGTFLGPADHTSASLLRDVEFRTDLGRFAYVGRTSYGDR
jgi:hypothetical protein